MPPFPIQMSKSTSGNDMQHKKPPYFAVVSVQDAQREVEKALRTDTPSCCAPPFTLFKERTNQSVTVLEASLDPSG